MEQRADAISYAWDDVSMPALGVYMTRNIADCVSAWLLSLPEGRMLDIGCGTGKYMRLAENFNWRTVGLDYDLAPLGLFKQRTPAACVVRGDGQALPFADGSFELVLAAEVQDYFSDRPAFYREVYRVLTEHGLFLVTISNRRSIKGLMTIIRNGLLGKKSPARFYEKTFDACLEELHQGGFFPLAFHGYNWNCLPRRCDNVTLVNIFAAVERKLGLASFPRYSPLVCVTCRKNAPPAKV